MRVKGRTCVRLDTEPRISFAHRLQGSFVDGSAKYQLNLFAFAGLLLLLVPISIGVRDSASVKPQRPSIDAAPWRQSLLPSPLGTIDRTVFSLPRPVGTLMPNFVEDWLERFGNLPDASLPNKRFRAKPRRTRSNSGDRPPDCQPFCRVQSRDNPLVSRTEQDTQAADSICTGYYSKRLSLARADGIRTVLPAIY